MIAAVAGPLLVNSAAKLATTWFRPVERAIATSLGAVFLEVGLAIAYKMPAFYFYETKEEYEGK